MSRGSRNIRKMTAELTGEADWLARADRDVEKSRQVAEGMSTPFGAALYAALEDLERTAYLGMANTNPLNIFKQIEYRVELRTAQYIKGKIESHVVNLEALEHNLKEMYGEVEDD